MKSGVYGGGKPGAGRDDGAAAGRKTAADDGSVTERKTAADDGAVTERKTVADDGLAVYIHFRTAGVGVRTATFFAGYCRASLTRELWFRATARILPILPECAERHHRRKKAGMVWRRWPKFQADGA